VTNLGESVLRREILAQPEDLERFRVQEGSRVLRLAQDIRAHPPRGVLIAARGSSDHAAVYAKYLLGLRLRMPVALAAPSLVTRYGGLPDVSDWLVLGISQSGVSPDIVSVLDAARGQGCRTVALTNQPDSPLARVASEIVELRVREERSVAATTTFTATLYALATLASAWAGNPENDRSELDTLPARVQQTLEGEPKASELASRLSALPGCVVLGRGFGFPVALEWALKLKEVAAFWAEPYSSADYRHGPIALASRELAALCIEFEGPIRSDLDALRQDLIGREMRVVRAADDPAADLPFAAGPEWLAPIPAAIPGQLLALHLARARNRDPDRPEGITKITRTF
jgi:glucosamine--fructose-6-phosphate aminotransferase (isomerizing)